MQTFKDLYLELATKITTDIPAIKWVDLWHNQVNFLEDEYAFPTPAVFFGFRSKEMTDTGKKVQSVDLQVDVYLFFETYADTYKGSINEDDALNFLDTLDDIFKSLHGSSGEEYSSMRRVAMGSVDTGGAGNLYLTPYECLLQDYGVDAHNTPTTDLTDNDLEVEEGTGSIDPGDQLFDVGL